MKPLITLLLISAVYCSLVHVSITAQSTNGKKSIMVITHNVASMPASNPDLKNLLNLDTNQLPDLIAIGFQEVKYSPTSFRTTDYEKKVFEILSGRNYKLVDSIRLVGLLLVVYARNDNGMVTGTSNKPPSIETVEKSWVRTGFGGLFGNKGAVGISLVLNGKRVAIVNSHLAPHEGRLADRINDYNTIANGLTFSRHGKVLDHDYTIWFGDLNFRVEQFSGQTIVDSVSRNERTPILERDELTIVRNEGRAFHGFRESTIEFNPTYKFYPNGNSYNLKRKPAWTDRILYRMKPGEPGLDASQSLYTGHFDLRTSDHRPVTSVITINA